MTPKEKEAQLMEWNLRNAHVCVMVEKARWIVSTMIQEKSPKEDVILLGELILDIGKRLD